MSRKTYICRVRIEEPIKKELNVEFVLFEKSTRVLQKIKTLEKYVQQHPTGWKKHLQLGDLLYEQGIWTAAIAAYRQVIERQPQLISLRIKLGKILQLIGQLQEAIFLYQDTISVCSQRSTQQHIQGLLSSCYKHFDQAEHYFYLAAQEEVQNPAHWLALGRTQLQQQKYDDALTSFEKILDIQNNDLIALCQIHDLQVLLNQEQEAAQILQQLEALAPNDYLILKRQLEQRLRQNLIAGLDGKQTHKNLLILSKLAPHAVNVAQLRAQYHQLRGEHRQYLATWEKFTQSYPDNPQGWYCYAQALYKKNEDQIASKAIFKAYRLCPQNTQIRILLVNIWRRAGKSDELLQVMYPNH